MGTEWPGTGVAWIFSRVISGLEHVQAEGKASAEAFRPRHSRVGFYLEKCQLRSQKDLFSPKMRGPRPLSPAERSLL